MSEPIHETTFLAKSGKHRDVELHMSVHNETAEVVLVIATGWARSDLNYHSEYVEFHAKTPLWNDHTPSDASKCPRRWEECYIDIRDGLANLGAVLLLNEGSDAVWRWLDELWHGKFGGQQ